MAPFILNDETKKNSHGFYLVNAGGRFERFTENPVMLYNHDLEQLVGKWLNLRTEGTLLKAEPEFDEGDPDAVKIRGKVDRGYLRGASPGIIILRAEWRENQVTNESELYVTDWELFEGSVVSVPSNAGALSLKIYDSNHCLVADDQITCHVENIIKLSVSEKSKTVITMNEEIKLSPEAMVVLGITGKSTPEAISSAVLNLKVRAEKSEAELIKIKEEEKSRLKTEAETVVELAINEGRTTADNRNYLVNLYLEKPEETKKFLESLPAKQSLAAQIKGIAGASDIPAERQNWTILQWMKNDMTGLKRLQVEQPEVYEELKNKH